MDAAAREGVQVVHGPTKLWRPIAIVAIVFALAAAGLIVRSPVVKADHDTAPWGPNVTLTSGGSVSNYTAAILDDGNGHTYIFRFYNPAGGNNLYVYKYLNVGTNPLPVLVSGFPVQVNGLSNVVDWQYTGPQAIASAAIDHAGNLYLAWTHTATGASGRDVYISRSTNGGVSWSLTNMVNAATSGEADAWPAIAARPDGTVVVAWVQTMGVWSNITVSASADQGATWTAQRNVTERSAPSAGVDPPKLAVDSLGRIYLAYSRHTSGRTFVNLTWSDGGDAWVAPVNLNSGTTSSGQDPAITVDYANRLHVAWQDSRETFSGAAEIFYVSSSDRGATWTPQVPVSQGVAPFAGDYDTQIATKGDNVLINWDVYGLTTPDGWDQSYVISADHGGSWYPEVIKPWGVISFGSYLTVDRNGTFYLGTTLFSGPQRMALSWWHSPPSTPVLAAVTPGSGSLTVSWNAPPEADISAFRVLRSNDGSTYAVVDAVGGSATSFTDSGLANGTYWYKLESVDYLGYVSHDSQAMAGYVGPTVAQLNDEIAALQAQLASLSSATSAQIAALETQIAALQTQLANTQSSQSATLAAIQANITALQGEINSLQSQQATQTISYANLAFQIIVVVLLIVVLLNQMRRPKSPQLMMAQPGQVVQPSKPDDDL